MTRNTLIEHNVLEYIESQPNLENLTKSERRGQKKLARRVKSGEIVVYTTDKSSKLATATRESYERQGDVHCSGDPIVTWDEVAMSKKIILGHCKAFNRILKIGESHGRQSMERAWEAKELDSSTVPVVKFLAKDHKAAETNGDPKTRPVCCCSTSINGEMSEYVSDLLEAALSAQGSKESISTEDLLSMVDNAVKRALELGYPPGEIFIGSLDVKALYQSLDIAKTSKICAKIFANSGVKIGGIDWGWVTTYIGLTHTEDEIREAKIADLAPTRITRGGPNAPTILTIKTEDKKPRWRPRKPVNEYTPNNQTRLLEAMMAKMISVTFKTHFYRWKGQIHHQAKGGPIGLRATGVCAKVVMEDWIAKFREILELNNVEILVLTKYVDDVLIICRHLPLGAYWNGNRISHCRNVKMKHVTSGMSRDRLTLEVLKDIAGSVHDFLEFTGECVENNIPIACLDTQLWMGKIEGNKWHSGENSPQGELPPNNINVPLYKFFKKPVASKIGTLARSAVPKNNKVQTAVNEFRRRWKTTSTLVNKSVIDIIW